MKRYISLLLVAAMSVGVISCTKTTTDEAYEKVPPGPVSNVVYEPDYGGGILSYTIPNDPDFLYVRAEFTIESGMTVSRTSSRFNNTLELTGMGAGPYEVRLYAVDVNGNESEPVSHTVQPLGATVGPISQTIDITPGFGLFYVEIENIYNTVVDVCVDLWADNELLATRTYTTSATDDRVKVANLDRDTQYTLDVTIRDNRYGYESHVDKAFLDMQVLYDDTLKMRGKLRVISDYELYGSYWDYTAKSKGEGEENANHLNPNNYKGQPVSLIKQDGVEVSGDFLYTFAQFRNAALNFNATEVPFLWDNDLNTYLETGDWKLGSGWPWNYFIDMGREVQLSRFRIWQLGDGTQFGHADGGCKTVAFYGSNDPNPEDGILDDWTLIGIFSIQKPEDAIDEEEELVNGTEFHIDEDNPQFSRTFRYWRFQGVEAWPQVGEFVWTAGRVAEVMLFGREVEEDTTDNQ